MTRNPFADLGKDVAEAMGDAPCVPANRERAALLHRMERDLRRRHRNAVVAAGTSTVGLLALAVAWLVTFEKTPGPELRHEDGKAVAIGEWLSPQAVPLELHSHDGSKLTIERETRARVSSLDTKGVRVALESGRLRARVHHRGGFRWSFRAGPYEVVVLGTALAIEWRADARTLAVGVREGVVRVKGDHLGRAGMVVQAGQRLRAALAHSAVSITPLDGHRSEPVADAAAAPDARDIAMPDLALPNRAVPRALPTRWRRLAAAGDYRAAVREARRAGLKRLLSRLDGAGLMLLADAARLAGNVALAVRAYTTLRRRFPTRAPAHLAAFRLGRLYYDQRHDYRRAARWFGRYLREQPKGALAADARGRYMTALERAGNLREARRVARRYLALHPGGVYAASARALLD